MSIFKIFRKIIICYDPKLPPSCDMVLRATSDIKLTSWSGMMINDKLCPIFRAKAVVCKTIPNFRGRCLTTRIGRWNHLQLISQLKEN